MFSILEKSRLIKELGYEEEYAEAQLAQEIILYLISKSKYVNNITIKGGVLLKAISKEKRRTTLDIDLDFIKYPLTEENIYQFIDGLQNEGDLKLKIIGNIEELMHQEYKGKRVFIEIKDSYGDSIITKIDIGVHKQMNLQQEVCCFDLSFTDEGVSLFANSIEQIFTEKLKSILRFGFFSTRYKDVYDIYYLLYKVEQTKLKKCITTLIVTDNTMKENNIKDITIKIKQIFTNNSYINKLKTSRKNWLNISHEEIIVSIIEFFENLNDN